MNDPFPDPNSPLWDCPAYVVFFNKTGNNTCAPNGPIIDFVRGSQDAILLPSIVYTAILMTLGLPGNLAVIFVYLFKMDKTPSRRFFIALAVCDFVNCVFGMPVELALLSNFYTFDYPMLCRISRFTNYFLNNTSSCLHISIAFDRYRRVKYPLRPAMTVHCFQLIYVAGVTFSFVSALPALFIYGTKSNAYDIPGRNGTYLLTRTCHVDDHADKTLRLSFSLYLLIATVLTFFLLMTVYGLITKVLLDRRSFLGEAHPKMKSFHSIQLRMHRKRGSEPFVHFYKKRSSEPCVQANVEVMEPFRDRTHSDMSGIVIHGIKIRVGRTTFILFVVTLVFVLSFIPHLIIVNMRYTKKDAFTDLSPVGWQVFHVALRSYLLNSAVNPIIYCFLNSDFRTKVLSAMKDVFFFCRKRKS